MPKGLTMIRIFTPGKIIRDSFCSSHQPSPTKTSIHTQRVDELLSSSIPTIKCAEKQTLNYKSRTYLQLEELRRNNQEIDKLIDTRVI